jgi:hypothetical protein
MRRLLTAIAFLFLCTGCGNGPATTTTSNKKDDERAHPDTYIKVNYEVRRNLVGKKVVEGEIINTGKYLTYKTVSLRIVSYNDGDENTVSYTVPDAVAPGAKAEFKFKPEGNPDRVKVFVAGASAD